MGWQVGYNYFNGQLQSEYRNNTTYFIHADHLGSTRLLTDMNKAIAQNLDYLPFGENNSSDSGISTHEFTGNQRDGESGLDHTLFRKYSSQLGRWTSPDPAGRRAVSLSNPQSWNRYVYVLNNPLNLFDRTGLDDCTTDGGIPAIAAVRRGHHKPRPLDCGGGGGGIPTDPGTPTGPTLGGSIDPNAGNTPLDPNAGQGIDGQGLTAILSSDGSIVFTNVPPTDLTDPLAGTNLPIGISGQQQQALQQFTSLVTGSMLFIEPVENLALNGMFFVGAGVLEFGGGAAIAAGCGAPGVDILTCAPSAAAGVVVMGGGAALGAAGVQFFNQVTAPSFQQWWNTFGMGNGGPNP